ncbi:hypothetical protein RM697_12790 [Ichthyenterobacterium sp. W332]|uniref:Uncharacterized protein n=1 Tax=Microcosmobacter mediterraneus TaxID=3075607 RepID=A0ABU2YMZ2_9FLAO|nr:hypothetical protein [Ichthyenterobacterium sp. W332]MDT0559533.1 hypothetical protein [Ichthyenterobacterium sp. W332]
MRERILHISKLIIGLCLVASVMMPTLVKFSHAFNHHKHEVCEGDSALHFHELDLECDYFKFKLNNHYYSFTERVVNNEDIFVKENLDKHYFFYNSYQFFSFYLRGPPSVV